MREPFLDTIETSMTAYEVDFLNNINGFDDSACIETVFDLDHYKRLTLETAQALNSVDAVYSDIRDKADLILNCGTDIELNKDGKVVASNFCRLRLCPMCQRRKSLKTFSDFSRIYAELRNFAFLHLTLTVPNVPESELAETIDYMNKCSTRLFKIAECKKAFKGIARCLEVTYNSNTITFHPHFHCLIAVAKSYFTSRDYIKHSRIVDLWSALWHHRFEEFRRLKDEVIYTWTLSLRKEDLLQCNIKKADAGALPEIAKYAVKPLDLNLPIAERGRVLQALYVVLKGRRLIQTYGEIRRAAKALKIDLNADDAGELDMNAVRRYNWSWALSHYELCETI